MLVTLNEVLLDAQKNGYAVGLFDTMDSDMLQAVIEAAEAAKSPVIIGTAESLLPYGSIPLLTSSEVDAARAASVPVVLHYDHGGTYQHCLDALRLGYSSVMFDGSVLSFEENIAQTAEIVKIAHAFGATVEGEIGHVGQAADSDEEDLDRYTKVADAVRFVNETGVDALAVAIGTAHGAYKAKPKLDFNRLAEIRAAIPTPLVLHGGSGLSENDFRTAIAGGIAKINVFTDMCVAGENAMRETVGQGYLTIRNAKVDAMREAVMKKMAIFGSCGRA